MSAERLKQIFEDHARRLDGVKRIDDPTALLADVFSDVVRQLAETVFLKVQTEPGWTDESAEAMAREVFQKHALLITDTIHAHGGTLGMVEAVVMEAASAYARRLAELEAAGAYGGGVA